MAHGNITIPVPGELRSAAQDGIVAAAEGIFDYKKQVKQEDLNSAILEEKEYDSTSQNGMGRVVLKKNMVNGVNTLTQSMMTATNTIYVIQYDFELAENVTIPQSCILQFEGGSLRNGVINGNNTSIVNPGLKDDIFSNITKRGTWKGVEVRLNDIDSDINNLESSVSSINSRVSTNASNISSVSGRVSVTEQDISNLKTAYAGLTQNDIIVGALPSTGVANKIYRVPGETSYSDYMWNGSAFVKMAEYGNAIDATPTKNSNNLVDSNGIYGAVVNGGIEVVKTYTVAAQSTKGNGVGQVDFSVPQDVYFYSELLLKCEVSQSGLEAEVDYNIQLVFYETSGSPMTDFVVFPADGQFHYIRCKRASNNNPMAKFACFLGNKTDSELVFTFTLVGGKSAMERCLPELKSFPVHSGYIQRHVDVISSNTFISQIPIKKGQCFKVRVDALVNDNAYNIDGRYVTLFGRSFNMVETNYGAIVPINGGWVDVVAERDHDLVGIGVYADVLDTEELKRVYIGWRMTVYAYNEESPLYENKKSLIAVTESDKDIEKIRKFSKMFNNTEDIESFLFFTDAHIASNKNTLNEEMARLFNILQSRIEKVYTLAPVDFVINGGDNLNDSDSQETAILKLGYMDSVLQKITNGNYYPVLGNHDTNYQGVVSAEDVSNGRLDNKTIANTMFRRWGRNYYSFNGNTTRFFVFDTGLDRVYDHEDSSYDNEQILWFINELLNNDAEHMVIVGHLWTADYENRWEPLQTAEEVADAFNRRGTYTFKGTTYNFASGNGIVHCIMNGHEHGDAIYTEVLLPRIVTKAVNIKSGVNQMDWGWSFDLVLLDYKSNQLKTVRIGTGEDRVMDLWSAD